MLLRKVRFEGLAVMLIVLLWSYTLGLAAYVPADTRAEAAVDILYDRVQANQVWFPTKLDDKPPFHIEAQYTQQQTEILCGYLYYDDVHWPFVIVLKKIPFLDIYMYDTNRDYISTLGSQESGYHSSVDHLFRSYQLNIGWFNQTLDSVTITPKSNPALTLVMIYFSVSAFLPLALDKYWVYE